MDETATIQGIRDQLSTDYQHYAARDEASGGHIVEVGRGVWSKRWLVAEGSWNVPSAVTFGNIDGS